MSEIQETDKAMRIFAIIGGFISLIESLLALLNLRLMQYGEFFGFWGGILGIIFAILVILLGIKPIHYTPLFLGILGVALIIFGVLIGGIFVLLATFIGAIS